MSVTSDMLREAMKSREYPEGSDRVWAVLEGAFVVWCIAVFGWLGTIVAGGL